MLIYVGPEHDALSTSRLEATYEIREDIANVLGRMGAYWDDDDRVRFAGWARMGLPLSSFKVGRVLDRWLPWDGRMNNCRGRS